MNCGPNGPPCVQRPASGWDRTPEAWPYPTWMDSKTLAHLAREGDFNARTWQGMKEFMEWFLHGADSFPRRPIFGCIVAGLTMSLKLGASACVGKGGCGYAIAIEAGSPLQVYNALIRLLAVPEVLSQYRSQPARSLSQRLALPILTGEGNCDVLFGESAEAPAAPSDPKLLGALGKILTLSMHFLFLHELSHVLVGHVEGSADIRRESHGVPAQARQAFLLERLLPLEFMADCRARLLSAALLNSVVAGARRPPDPSIRPDIVEHFYFLGFGMGVLFLLLEVSRYSGRTHPPAVERAYCLRAYTGADPEGKILGFEHIPTDEGYRAIDRGFEDATKAWDALGWGRQRSLPTDGGQLLKRMNDAERTIRNPPCVSF